MKRMSSGFCRSSGRNKPPERSPARKRSKVGEGRIRIFGTRELLDDQWHELDDIVAHLLAAQRPVFPCPPAAHRGGDVLRLPETQHRQPIERVALDVGADEREVLLLGEEGRRALEQSDIVLLDLVQMNQQSCRRNRRGP